VLKIDSDGAIIWSRTFGGSGTDNCNDVEFYDGIIYVIGETYSNDYDVSGIHGSRDGWLLKLTNDGNFVQQKCFGGSSFEELFDIVFISDNEILLTGVSGSNNGDLNKSLWNIKLFRLLDFNDRYIRKCYMAEIIRRNIR
jgi:hypothetical protein